MVRTSLEIKSDNHKARKTLRGLLINRLKWAIKTLTGKETTTHLKSLVYAQKRENPKWQMRAMLLKFKVSRDRNLVLFFRFNFFIYCLWLKRFE